VAVTDVAPLSPPLIKVAYTVFVVPVKLAQVAFAWNAYRKVPVGFISASRLTPSMTPLKANDNLCRARESQEKMFQPCALGISHGRAEN
jgi:hypothetical protein